MVKTSCLPKPLKCQILCCFHRYKATTSIVTPHLLLLCMGCNLPELSGISGAVVCQQSFFFLNRERHPLRVNCPSQEHNTLLGRVDSDQDFSKLIAVNDNVLGKI